MHKARAARDVVAAVRGARDPHLAHRLYIALLVFAGYYIGARIGLALTFPTSPLAALWPPNSILFAALLLTAPRDWWVALFAALWAHLLAELQGGVPALMVVCWFVSNACEALVGALCLRRLVHGRLAFDTLRNVIAFFVAAVVATFASSFLDSAFVVLNQWGTRTYSELWQARFVSNLVASLTLVPLIVTWAAAGLALARTAGRARLLEGAVLLIALLALSILAFAAPIWTSGTQVLLYLPLPLLLWATLRFGPVGATTSFTILAFLIIWSAGHGEGPLGAGSTAESSRSIQLFLLFTAPSLLLLAAVLEERKHAETDVRESRERLRLALEGGRIGVWDWDPRNGAVTWSEEHYAIMGFVPFTVRPNYDVWARCVHADDLPHATAAMERAISRHSDYRCEYRIVLPDGTHRWVESRAKPLFGRDGKCCRVMGLAFDITERRQADELHHKLAHSSRLAAMGELTASIAHEINQPISAILSNVDAAEMLLDAGNANGGELRQILNDIRNDDLRASEVVRHVRAMARNRTTEAQPFELNDLIGGVLRLVAPTAQRRGIAIDATYCELPTVHGDPIQVQQVLLNLLFNAMDAMSESPEGRRRIVVRTSRDAQGAAEIEVSDRGHGIPPQQTDKIFESFYTTKKDGMGLGLSIARTLVEAHGGRIWATNNRDGGASFRFTLGRSAHRPPTGALSA